MADSVTTKLRVLYAINGDYGALPVAVDYGAGRDFVSATVTRQKQLRESVPLSPGIVFSMADFTTIQQIYVLNEDANNFVTVAWTSAGAANSQKVPPTQPFLIPQADIASVTITANTAACVCTLIVFGT